MEKWFKKNRRILVMIAFLLVFALVIPRVTDGYSMTVMNSALFYFVAALGISVMLGMGGQISFATSAFIGFGAFITTNLSVRMNFPPLVSLILAVVGTALFACLIGMPLFRLSGSYFTFASIALVQIMWNLYTNAKAITGGPDGISRIPKLHFGFWGPQNVMDYFYVLLVFCAICALVVERIRSSRLGRSLAAIRDNEIAAQSLGVNVYRTKVISFVIAGAFAGLSGALMAHHNSFVAASQFTFDQSTTFVIMVMLGGVSSTPGAFIGALLVTMLPEWMRPLKEYIRFIYGIVIMILMVFMPMGLAGMWHAIWGAIKRKRNKEGRSSHEALNES